MPSSSPIDVLILTAADGEPEGVLAVSGGRVGEWREEPQPPGWIGTLRRAEFRTRSGRLLQVVLARTLAQGPQAAANACGVLVPHFQPKCLAMAGVCAGRPGRTSLGDAVLAERLFRYDQGAEVAGDDGVPYTDHDITTYQLGADWKNAAEELRAAFAGEISRGEAPEWLATRPPTLLAQQWWLLDSLARGEDPLEHPQVNRLLPSRTPLLRELRDRGWIRLGPIALTPKGAQALAEERELQGEDLLKEPPWRLHVEPMGTGEKLIRNPQVWDLLRHLQRHSVALEMEGAAVGYSGWAQEVERCIVVKGVMDNGDPAKGDTFREFAARAAAEVLLRFLRENLEPRGAAPAEILRPGTGELQPDQPPSALLVPRYQVIRFREALLGPLWQELQDWARSGDRVSVRLFTGPGGAGKTRVFQELAVDLRKDGAWDAGFLLEAAGEGAVAMVIGSGRPALVVLDYAESHLLRDPVLKAALQAAATRSAPLRIALLARNAGDWWQAVKASTSWDGLLDALPRELPEVRLEEDTRAEFFAQARADLGIRLGKPCTAPVPDLSHSRFGRPLYLAVAALAQVEGLPTGPDEVLSAVLAHEARFWKAHLPETEPHGIRAYLAAATLLGGLPTIEAAEGLADRLGLDPGLCRLNRLYPSRGTEGRREHTAPLEPDLLGETLVAEVMTHAETRAEYLERVFREASPEAVQHGLTVLGRLEIRHGVSPERVAEWYRQVLSANLPHRALPAVHAALNLGTEALSFTLGRVLAAVLEAQGDHHLAESMVNEIPFESHSLHKAAAWCLRKLLENEALPPHVRARHLGNLGSHYSALGRREAALAATEEAVEQYRKLNRTLPDAFLPDLASSLNNLGNRYSALGRREAALAATEEAAGIRRELVVARPDIFLPDLAMSLNNLGSYYSALGRREAALAATEEAVGIRRGLAATRPDAFLPALAASLNNLGNCYSVLGQREAAFAAAAEAAKHYRELAVARPDVFLPGLARSLNNLGNRYGELGRWEKALQTTEGAVAIQRKLAEAQPDAFLPDLAQSLNSLGSCYSALGRREEALQAAQVATELYRELTEARPDAFLPTLAGSLTNLGNRYSALGQREAALAATAEAEKHYRKLAAARPDIFLPDLAMSLNNLGNYYSALGQREAALAATEEAVGIRRELAAARPDAFLPNLAGSLTNLGSRYNALGQREAALAAAEEAAKHYRELAVARPDVFLPDMAVSLMAFALVVADPDPAEAVLPATEALGIFTALVRKFPAAFEARFMGALMQLIQWKQAAGQDPEEDPVILAASETAVELGFLREDPDEDAG